PPARSTLFPYTTLFRSSPTFWMYPLIALAGDSTTCFLIFTDCNLKLRITGGVPSGNPSVALVGELPQPGDPVRGGCWNQQQATPDRKSTRLNSSHEWIS